MKCVFVLMYKKDGTMTPYAVFEDSITAERMKRDGDEIAKVPYFSDEMPNVLRINEGDLKGMPLSIPCGTHITYQHPEYHPDSTLAPFPPPSYPKVTCQKTVDEHTWTNRSD